jgi:cytidyltransferase-like protein
MKVGITFSTFDLLHAGHVKMLEEAKRQCDYLIVGLQLDPSIDRPEKNAPSQSIIERYIQLKGSKYVDEIVPYVSEQDLEDIFALLNWMCASLVMSIKKRILQVERIVKRKESISITTLETTDSLRVD